MLFRVGGDEDEEEDDVLENLLLDLVLMFLFMLLFVIDMFVFYGVGFGGVNCECERKYILMVLLEFLDKLEVVGGGG